MMFDEMHEVVENVEANEEVATATEEVKAEEVVNAAAEVKAEDAKPTSFMEEALKSMVEIRVGKRLECTVVEIREDGVVVSCNQKKDGFISVEELGSDISTLNVGDTFKAELIENKSANKEFLFLSKKNVDEKLAAKAAKEQAEKEMLSGDFEVTISGVNKGGLVATKGDYSVFIPKSQVAIRRKDAEPLTEEQLQEYVGKTYTVRKLDDKESEQKKGRKRIVASIREVLFETRRKEAEARKKAREEKIANEKQERIDIFNANADRLQPNLIVPGKVKKFVSFGVFVDVYGFRALCPVGEVSWVRDTDPQKVFEINKEYEFLITKVNVEKYEVTLSYKTLQKKPSELAQEKYPIGTVVKGVVQSIVNFGAFVSLEPGVDGLIHKSNISYERVEDVNDVLTVGQEVEAKVIAYKQDGISLSIKDLLPNPNPQPKTERSEHSRPRPEKNVGEKKAKRNDDSYESQEEKENYEAFGGHEAASNPVFSSILGGLFGGNNDNGNENK